MKVNLKSVFERVDLQQCNDINYFCIRNISASVWEDVEIECSSVLSVFDDVTSIIQMV